MRTWSEANHLRTEWDVKWQSIHFDVVQPRPMGGWLYDYNSRCQMQSYDLVRHLTKELVTGSAAIWDAWAVLNGHDPEIGYIHNPTGIPPNNRTNFITESGGSVWVANMGNAIWRSHKVAEVIKLMKQQELPYTYHGEGVGNCPYDPFPLFIYDLAFYPLAYDTGYYNIATCAEYKDVPFDYDNPFVLGFYDFLAELKAALALDPIVEHVKIMPNYGATAGLYYDPIVTAQLAIVEHAQTQVFATSTTLSKNMFDNLYNKIKSTAAAGITTYNSYVDLTGVDEMPTAAGKELSNALFQLMQDGDLVPARYKTTLSSFPPEDLGEFRESKDWEYNAMFRSGRLGDATEAVQHGGTGNRLLSREHDNGIVYLFLKANQGDASDIQEITVPAGAKRLNQHGALIDIAEGAYELTANEGITLITTFPGVNEITLIEDVDVEGWPLENPRGIAHDDAVKSGMGDYDDGEYIQSGTENAEDRFIFSFPVTIDRLVEYKARIRAWGQSFSDAPALRAIFWADGDAWQTMEVHLRDGYENLEIPFCSLNVPASVLSGGGMISVISFKASSIQDDNYDPFQQ